MVYVGARDIEQRKHLIAVAEAKMRHGKELTRREREQLGKHYEVLKKRYGEKWKEEEVKLKQQITEYVDEPGAKWEAPRGGVSQVKQARFYVTKEGKKTYRVGDAPPPEGATPISYESYQQPGRQIRRETHKAAAGRAVKKAQDKGIESLTPIERRYVEEKKPVQIKKGELLVRREREGMAGEWQRARGLGTVTYVKPKRLTEEERRIQQLTPAAQKQFRKTLFEEKKQVVATPSGYAVLPSSAKFQPAFERELYKEPKLLTQREIAKKTYTTGVDPFGLKVGITKKERQQAIAKQAEKMMSTRQQLTTQDKAIIRGAMFVKPFVEKAYPYLKRGEEILKPALPTLRKGAKAIGYGVKEGVRGVRAGYKMVEWGVTEPFMIFKEPVKATAKSARDITKKYETQVEKTIEGYKERDLTKKEIHKITGARFAYKKEATKDVLKITRVGLGVTKEAFGAVYKDPRKYIKIGIAGSIFKGFAPQITKLPFGKWLLASRKGRLSLGTYYVGSVGIGTAIADDKEKYLGTRIAEVGAFTAGYVGLDPFKTAAKSIVSRAKATPSPYISRLETLEKIRALTVRGTPAEKVVASKMYWRRGGVFEETGLMAKQIAYSLFKPKVERTISTPIRLIRFKGGDIFKARSEKLGKDVFRGWSTFGQYDPHSGVISYDPYQIARARLKGTIPYVRYGRKSPTKSILMEEAAHKIDIDEELFNLVPIPKSELSYLTSPKSPVSDLYKQLGYSKEDIPYEIRADIIKQVWQRKPFKIIPTTGRKVAAALDVLGYRKIQAISKRKIKETAWREIPDVSSPLGYMGKPQDPIKNIIRSYGEYRGIVTQSTKITTVDKTAEGIISDMYAVVDIKGLKVGRLHPKVKGRGYETRSLYIAKSTVGGRKFTDFFYGKGFETGGQIIKGYEEVIKLRPSKKGFDIETGFPKFVTKYKGKPYAEEIVGIGEDQTLRRSLYMMKTKAFDITTQKQLKEVTKSVEWMKETARFGVEVPRLREDILGKTFGYQVTTKQYKFLQEGLFKEQVKPIFPTGEKPLGGLFHRTKGKTVTKQMYSAGLSEQTIRQLFRSRVKGIGSRVRARHKLSGYKQFAIGEIEPEPLVKIETGYTPSSFGEIPMTSPIGTTIMIPLVTTTPTLKPSTIPTLKPSLKPAIKPAIKPTVKPVIKPAIKTALLPAIKPALKPALKTALKPALKPALKQTLKPVLKAKLYVEPTMPHPPPPLTILRPELQFKRKRRKTKKKKKRITRPSYSPTLYGLALPRIKATPALAKQLYAGGLSIRPQVKI